MKRTIAGDGSDSTVALTAWLNAGSDVIFATLYLIGNPEDPQALYLTDWESPIAWPIVGTFWPSVITRGSLKSSIGLEVATLDISWSPPVGSFSGNIATTSPYQLARLGVYDNLPVRVWCAWMPTPGDANTFGCSEYFGGRIASARSMRGKIEFTLNSFLDVVNMYVPTNVVELSNTAAAYKGAVPPAGMSAIPQFQCVAGGSPSEVIGAQLTPVAGGIVDTNKAQNGYLVFNYGAGATLGGMWAAIAQNIRITISGTDYNQFSLYSPLPWAPSASDTFYVSGKAPIDQADGDYVGFPYVPNPQLAA